MSAGSKSAEAPEAQALCAVFLSKGDPSPHGVVTPHKQEELELSAHWAAKEAERDRVQEHIGKKMLKCCILNISFIFYFGVPFPPAQLFQARQITLKPRGVKFWSKLINY